MSGFAKRPEGEGYCGSIYWVPGDKRFCWTEPHEDGNGFENVYGVIDKFRAIQDPQNWRRAWFGYVEPMWVGEDKLNGGMLVRQVRPVTEELGEKPQEPWLKLMNSGWASGLLIRMALVEELGGGRKELSKSTQVVMFRASRKFYNLWLAEKDQHPGLLPVSKLIGVEKYHTWTGFTNEPIWALDDEWAPRPENMPDEPFEGRPDPPAAVEMARRAKPRLRVVNGDPVPDYDDSEPDISNPPDYPEAPFDPDYDGQDPDPGRDTPKPKP
jgi:hypothetical protein